MKPEKDIRLTVDAVVFGYGKSKKVNVLLVQRKYPPFQHSWALPGGFVLEGEDLEAAVERELREESGVSINYLEQLYTFGKPGRDPRGRVVTVAYFGLVRPDGFKLTADTDAEDVAWYPIDDLPDLAFDHKHILQTAIDRLSAKITYEPIGFELLDKKFPFSDLEHLYTALLGRPIDRRNFRKKMLSLGVLEETKEKVSMGPGRPATLFRFRKERYDELKKQGVGFGVLI